MERRDAVKSISAILGYSLTYSATAGFLSSCGEPREVIPDWKPVFFSEQDARVVEELAEVILPRTTTPGAKDAQVIAYIDDLFRFIYKKEESDKFMEGFKRISEKAAGKFSKPISELSAGEFGQLLNGYFDIPEEAFEQNRRAAQQDVVPVEEKEKAIYYEYYFCVVLKSLTVSGYFTSKLVGTEVLVYDPVPGDYNPCLDVTPDTRISSL